MTKNSKCSTYLKKSIFEKYEENPFVEKAISVIKENSVIRRQYINGERGVQQIITNPDTGEIVGQAIFAKIVEVDEDKFAKLYLSQLGLLWDMKKPALRVFSFVLANLTPNSDQFYLSISKALKYTGYKSKSQLNNGIAQLLEIGIIAKTTEEHWYFINPLFFFNGNRITFAKTYIKKSNNKNLNQLDLFQSDASDNGSDNG